MFLVLTLNNLGQLSVHLKILSLPGIFQKVAHPFSQSWQSDGLCSTLGEVFHHSLHTRQAFIADSVDKESSGSSIPVNGDSELRQKTRKKIDKEKKHEGEYEQLCFVRLLYLLFGKIWHYFAQYFGSSSFLTLNILSPSTFSDVNCNRICLYLTKSHNLLHFFNVHCINISYFNFF